MTSFPVPLGSTRELPAWSCKEIKSSEGAQMVSGNYWMHSSITPGEVSLVYCDVNSIDGEFCPSSVEGGFYDWKRIYQVKGGYRTKQVLEKINLIEYSTE